MTTKQKTSTKKNKRQKPRPPAPDAAPAKSPKPGKVYVSPEFDCDHSVHDREQFQQEERHLLPGLYEADHRTPRQWEGSEVHVLKLYRYPPPTSIDEPQEVLQVRSDSLGAALDLMRTLIAETFFAMHHAQQMQATTFEMINKMQAQQEELLRLVKEVGGSKYQGNDNAVVAACQLIRELGEAKKC
jgi:hypothetical protein